MGGSLPFPASSSSGRAPFTRSRLIAGGAASPP